MSSETTEWEVFDPRQTYRSDLDDILAKMLSPDLEAWSLVLCVLHSIPDSLAVLTAVAVDEIGPHTASAGMATNGISAAHG